MASRLTLSAIKSYVLDGYDGLALLEKYGYVDGKDQNGVDWSASNENLPQSELDTWEWINRKIDGARVASLLSKMEIGTQFRLKNVGRSYSATYRKNDLGLWDQVAAPERPLVSNMDADHLGFVVGFDAIVKVVAS